MIFKVQDLQNGEMQNVDVMVGEELTPDEVRVIGVDMSDEDCLFGHFLDDGYWITFFENEGLNGVQKQLKMLEDLPNKIDKLSDSIEDVFNGSNLSESEFIDRVQSGCVWCDTLADDPSAYAEEECAETDAQIINQFPYNQFFEYEDFGEWLIQNNINQGIMIEVNGNFYSID